jgi:hypothetical protein
MALEAANLDAGRHARSILLGQMMAANRWPVSYDIYKSCFFAAPEIGCTMQSFLRHYAAQL